MSDIIGDIYYKEGLDSIFDFVNLLELNGESELYDLRNRVFKFLESEDEILDTIIDDVKGMHYLRFMKPYNIICASSKEALDIFYEAKIKGDV